MLKLIKIFLYYLFIQGILDPFNIVKEIIYGV